MWCTGPRFSGGLLGQAAVGRDDPEDLSQPEQFYDCDSCRCVAPGLHSVCVRWKQPQEHGGPARTAGAPSLAVPEDGAGGQPRRARVPQRRIPAALGPPPRAAPQRSLRAGPAPTPDARAAIPAPRAEPEGAARSGAARSGHGAQGEGGHQGQEADLRGEPRDAALLPPHHPRGLRRVRRGQPRRVLLRRLRLDVAGVRLQLGGVRSQLPLHELHGQAVVRGRRQPRRRRDRPEHGAGDGRAPQGCDPADSDGAGAELLLTLRLVLLALGSGARSLPPVGEHPGALVYSRIFSPRSGAKREEATPPGTPPDEALLALAGEIG